MKHLKERGWPHFCKWLIFILRTGGSTSSQVGTYTARISFIKCYPHSTCSRGKITLFGLLAAFPPHNSQCNCGTVNTYGSFATVPGWCKGLVLAWRGSGLRCQSQPFMYPWSQGHNFCQWSPNWRPVYYLDLNTMCYTIEFWTSRGGFEYLWNWEFFSPLGCMLEAMVVCFNIYFYTVY